ncbi:MAG: DUF4290 domain-containing protein, partial [Bacteroides sp.]
KKRDMLSHTLVNLMSRVNPHLKDNHEIKYRLLNNIITISNDKLDITPCHTYDITDKKKITKQIYKTNSVKYKKYGLNIELMIDIISNIKDCNKRNELTRYVANCMKLTYITSHKEYISDLSIKNDLKIISKGILILDNQKRLNNINIKEEAYNRNNKKRTSLYKYKKIMK